MVYITWIFVKVCFFQIFVVNKKIHSEFQAFVLFFYETSMFTVSILSTFINFCNIDLHCILILVSDK